MEPDDRRCRDEPPSWRGRARGVSGAPWPPPPRSPPSSHRRPPPPARGPRAVAAWLFVVAAIVFTMIVVGGITRLTESGLSIVRWDPVGGIVPPLSAADWAREYAAYRTSPQGILVNAGMPLAAFKGIFFWEYLHRVIARLFVAALVLPMAWFAVRRQVPAGLRSTAADPVRPRRARAGRRLVDGGERPRQGPRRRAGTAGDAPGHRADHPVGRAVDRARPVPRRCRGQHGDGPPRRGTGCRGGPAADPLDRAVLRAARRADRLGRLHRGPARRPRRRHLAADAGARRPAAGEPDR